MESNKKESMDDKNNPLFTLKELGLILPEVTVPGGSYVSVNKRGNNAFIAIQFPIINGEFFYQGNLGKEISTAQGYEAMKLAALNVLSQINSKIGFNNLVGINHVDAYYTAENDWDQAPEVVNGASDLFLKVLGDKGVHSRAIFGVERLPFNLCVGISLSVTIKS